VRLWVFDQSVTHHSPAGSCVLAEVVGLAEEHEVTVLSARCDAPAHCRIRWLRVPLPGRPLLLRYALFQAIAPAVLWWHRLRGLPPADLVQTTQGQYAAADVAYAHFCHRAYLRGPWKASPVRGLRRLMRALNHRFNAFWEFRAFRRARLVVVPSRGLARELAAVYPEVADRLVTLANPVDLKRFARDPGFDRSSQRASIGASPESVVFVFVALGDFARKGLDLVLEALAALPQRERARLLVVGGRAGEIATWRRNAEAAGVAAQVVFVGLQPDVRPYLWASDAFVFASAYEIFSLALLQAAAASLPVIVSEGLYGAEEFVVNGANGWLVTRTADAVGAALQAAMADREHLVEMGRSAEQSVQRYSQEIFVQQWRELYARLARP
jgi:glycosyltransferase involved in cell wall biosynthesis